MLRRRGFKKPPEGLIISPISPNEAGNVIFLHKAVAEEHKYLISEMDEIVESEEEEAKTIQRICNSGNSIMLGAYIDGSLVGMATATGGNRKKTEHVTTIGIAVLPGYRDIGIGRKLMEAVIEWAKGNPMIIRISLSVFGTNERAIRLYKNLGFKVEGKRKGHFKIDNELIDEIMMGLFVRR